jgi:hypothetical protein
MDKEQIEKDFRRLAESPWPVLMEEYDARDGNIKGTVAGYIVGYDFDKGKYGPGSIVEFADALQAAINRICEERKHRAERDVES